MGGTDEDVARLCCFVVTPERIVEAFGAESDRLCAVLAGVDDAALAGASGCPPWSVADLVYHVRMTMGRLPGMLDAPDPAGTGLVTAAGYYRGDQRFSAGTNAERIRSAQRGAAALPRAYRAIARGGGRCRLRGAVDAGGRRGRQARLDRRAVPAALR